MCTLKSKLKLILLFILFATTVILSVVASACTSTPEPDIDANGLEYVSTSDGDGYEISGCISKLSGKIVIPEVHKGKPVVAIRRYALQNAYGIISVTLPSTITSIGENAFVGCKKLVEVCNNSQLNIVEGSEENGKIAFYALNVYSANGESKLETTSDGLVFYNGDSSTHLVGYIGEQNELSLPNSYGGKNYTVYEYAFIYDKFTSVYVPAEINEIAATAFYECAKLENINVDESNPAYLSQNGVLYNKNPIEILYVPQKLSGDITVYDGVKEIPNYAFADRYITSVVLPDSVTRIGDYAFKSCEDLSAIILGKNLDSICMNAFQDCIRLVEIFNFSTLELKTGSADCGGVALRALVIHTDESEKSNLVTVDDYLFYEGEEVYLVGYLGDGNELNFPQSFKGGNYSVLKYAFFSMDVQKINIPDCVKSIGAYAFTYCRSLKEVKLGNGVTEIGDYAFYGCTSLTTVQTGAALKSVGNYAFYECRKLTELDLSHASSIGAGAFKNCGSLEKVSLCDELDAINSEVFYSCAKLVNIEIPKGVKLIGSDAFCGDNFTKIDLPQNLETIGRGAFSSCNKLTQITIPDSVTLIGDTTFFSCDNLTKIEIGAGLSKVGERVLGVCHKLNTISVSSANKYFKDTGNCLVEISTGILYAGTNSSVIPTDGSVKEIATGAFQSLANLTKIVIPDSVEKIGMWAFHACGSLKSVTIGSGVNYIGSSAFTGCRSIKTMTVKNPTGWAMKRDSEMRLVERDLSKSSNAIYVFVENNMSWEFIRS